MNEIKSSEARAQFHALLEVAARAMVKGVMENSSHTRYIDDNEIALLMEGVRNGMLRVDGNVVRLESSETRPYDLFTLNREYLTQFAALVSLTTKYRYAPEDCKFEYHMMDICVFRDDKPFIYVETKVSERGTELMLKKLTEQYAPGVASMLEEHDRGNDPLRKAKYIFKDKPEYLWLVTPKNRKAFRVVYTTSGFSLESVPDIPSAR